MKKFISIIFAFCLCFSVGTTAFASTYQTTSSINLSNANEKFAQMTNEQLNNYIDSVQKSSKMTLDSTNYLGSTTASIKLAWLAAAQIARNMGYPCAAKMVECSVNNESYIENSDIFSRKIDDSSVYKNYLSSARSQKYTDNSIVFTKGDDSDLFYALHKVDIKTTGVLLGTELATYTVEITDRFNFNLDNNYDSLFTGTVNNWAWLCQQTSVLHDIFVSITFYDK